MALFFALGSSLNPFMLGLATRVSEMLKKHSSRSHWLVHRASAVKYAKG
ncbi:hypothetical protein EST38_g12434 [Candolleomyces aberdarensis]|uniref:Uncharacterized protein n=1 Tax=Candolleomyces aberdarensis TaxID=2316362 RepID=A0A4Q2D2G0_9AGAR|nr:hypothetical protein EST38_g12434 [Candolleomyces aberdarensis]